MKISKRKTICEIEKSRIINELKLFLEQEKSIIFAYLYGSFNEGYKFNDIDIAIYVEGTETIHEEKLLHLQLSLAAKAELLLDSYEIDLRILNQAPLSFKFNVVNNGTILFSRDKNQLIQFITRTRDFHFEFLPYRDFFYRRIVLGK